MYFELIRHVRVKTEVGRRLPAVIIFATALSLSASIAEAHPSVSVVIDSRGNVYYSDLKQVWRISPAGVRTLAVPGVHTHELAIDRHGNLYGEHLWYEGEASDRWGHFVWRMAPDGRVHRVKPATPGFLTNFSFVRDRAENQYWVDRARGTVMKKQPNGTISTLAKGRFRDVRWSTVTPDGTLYFIDVHDLVRVTPRGVVSVVARDLSPPHLNFTPGRAHHELMGLWTDSAGNVYVAHPKKKEIKKIFRDGRVSTILRSRGRWSPTGGAFAPNGDLWILEHAALHDVRVRRVSRNGVETLFPVSTANSIPGPPSAARRKGTMRDGQRYLLPPVLKSTVMSASLIAPRRCSSR